MISMFTILLIILLILDVTLLFLARGKVELIALLAGLGLSLGMLAACIARG